MTGDCSMSKKQMEFDNDTVVALSQELAKQLTAGDEHRQIISAMLRTLHDFEADAGVVLRVLSGALLLTARAQDAAAGAGAIVAIKLLALLMPGRDAHEVAEIALDMLKATANGTDDAPRHIRVVVIRGRED